MILADLHNHSCLSPCASLEMSPSLIARRAKARGVRLIALTDHNAALNCPAFADACAREGLAPLFGMEACSSEEVHVLAIFGGVDEALGFGGFLAEHLPAVPNDTERLGYQVVVDADEGILDMPARYLGSALDLGFDEICARAHDAGALVIPAHVDRPYFSVSSQLGFLPPGPYDAVEAMRPEAKSIAGIYPLICGSDAHVPEHVGRRPFLVDLDEEVLERGGPRLLEALRSALCNALPFSPA